MEAPERGQVAHVLPRSTLGCGDSVRPAGVWWLIPGAELALMPDTGHVALFAQSPEFSRITLDYLGG